jgi:2,3-bisphosphoglycerate-independent phosphoglycerate mutase
MRKAALIILDGWGMSDETENNGIHLAATPFFDYLWEHFPHTRLQASGEYVGLPEGQIGGSEVGHLTIGAGRVIYTELPRISKALLHKDENDGILNNPLFRELIHRARQKPIHLIGLVSTGGVHSHEEHLFSLLDILKEQNCMSPYIHFISDGRDTAPRSSLESAQKLLSRLSSLSFGKVVDLSGRFYAMDRDKNFDRTNQAADVMLHGSPGTVTPSIGLLEAIQASHANEITDEFIAPVVLDSSFAGIADGDALLFFNFRSDRMKQLISVISEKRPSSSIFTMTQYDASYKFPVLFEKHQIKDTLGEILSKYNLKQLRATETEKYAHVTYFFNGGVEIVFDGEIRSLTQSNKVRHDQIPEMKTKEITEQVRDIVTTEDPEFVLINFANPDMVGHTGNIPAIITGVETVDSQLKQICETLTSRNYVCFITADHGNAEVMYDLTTHEPHTAHTMNPVPFIVYDPHHPEMQSLRIDQNPSNGLSMIAGTVLEVMDVPGMQHTFESLIVK